MLLACASHASEAVYTKFKYHFMALSTLNPPLPALEDLITLTPHHPPKKKIGPQLTRDIRRDI
jgi:hypothetical protein